MLTPGAPNNTHYVSGTNTDAYEPFLVAGEACGEVHWLRTEGADGSTLAAGLWRSDARVFDYPFAADETIHVLFGELRVLVEDAAEPLVLRSGDIASFRKGTSSEWTVTDGFLKFFVVSG